MRILYVSPFPPARDGIGTYTETIITELRASGHKTCVIAARSESQGNPDVLAVLPTGATGLAELRGLIVDWRPDCIHVQFAVAAFGTRTFTLLRWLHLMRSTGIPVIITMHEVTRDVDRLRYVGRLIYRAFSTCCDHIIVHTQDAQSTCISSANVAPGKISVIPHPTADPPAEITTGRELRERFHLANQTVLLAFGFIHVDKGLPDLVRALAIIRGKTPELLDNIQVVVAGTVRQRSGIFRLFEFQDRLHLCQVRRLSKRSGIDRHFVYTGYVPTAEIAGWFHTAAAVVLPYRHTEQSGVAALANAFTVPVLASSVGGLRDLYSASKWTFPPRDPNALAQVLANFLTHSAKPTSPSVTFWPVNDLTAVAAATIETYRNALRSRERLPSGSGAEPGHW